MRNARTSADHRSVDRELSGPATVSAPDTLRGPGAPTRRLTVGVFPGAGASICTTLSTPATSSRPDWK